MEVAAPNILSPVSEFVSFHEARAIEAIIMNYHRHPNLRPVIAGNNSARIRDDELRKQPRILETSDVGMLCSIWVHDLPIH